MAASPLCLPASNRHRLLSHPAHGQVWPLDQPGELPWSLQRMERMHHSHYQYAGQWWLTQALRNASGLLTDNIDEACMVWVDSYCYNQAGGRGAVCVPPAGGAAAAEWAGMPDGAGCGFGAPVPVITARGLAPGAAAAACRTVLCAAPHPALVPFHPPASCLVRSGSSPSGPSSCVG